MFRIFSSLIIFSLITFNCRKSPKNPEECDFVNSSNDFFSIENNTDSPNRAFNVFCKKINVFGVIIYASSDVIDADILHAANIMAQYLDNDEDGLVDNPLVIENMLANKSCLIMFGKENSSIKKRFFNSVGDFYDEPIGQELFGDETHPEWDLNSPFDASLEEILHLITQNGFSKAYPSIFGEYQGSAIANAMDLARGGQFTSIPNSYPSGAWYSYNDNTCEYNCQITEYFYWSLTSLIGAQNYTGRFDEIAGEWKANTPALVQSLDPAVYALLTDTTYHLPLQLPDGSYRR